MRFPRVNAPSEAITRQRPQVRRLVALLPVLLASLGLVAAGGPQAKASSGASCSASYVTQSQFTGAFVAAVTVANTGTVALTGWTVTFTFGGDQTVTIRWDATITQSKETVTAINESFDGNVPVGGSAGFGFYGAWSTNDTPPASLTCTPAS